MVHGIGQRLEKSNLVDDVGTFRHVTASLAERHLTSHQRGTQRVLYIPCQWRKGLTLSGEAAVEKITLDGVRGLRTMLSATVHDVLYYMSPIYCQDIINSVSTQLNRLYLKFLKRNPGYDGKVSIYGHSLGSVLSYDILCHQETLYSSFPMEWMYKEPEKSQAHSSLSNDISPNCKTTSDVGDERVENSGGESTVSDADNPDLVEEHVEGVYNQLGPPVLSESDESTTNETTSHHEKFDLFTSDENHNKPSSLKSEIVPCDDDPSGEDTSYNDKDEILKSLTEEIELLKSQIKQFEAESADKVQVAFGDTLKSYTPQIRYTKLEFKVDTFFAVGSPLGVFLSLRNIRIGIGKGKQYWEDETINEEMPACRQMFNIFHPFDPVAYRVEPLICKEYVQKRPVIIPYHRGGKRLYVGYQEFKEGLAARSQAFADHLSSVKVKVLTICDSRSNKGKDEEPENSEEKDERSYGSVMVERLTGSVDGRVDHVLQDKTFRHPYVSAIGSHTNYWRDPDTALFMLRHLYRDIPEEPGTPNEQRESTSKEERSVSRWTDPREVEDEELPLTFADNMSIKNFSYKAKNIITKSR